MKVNIKKNLNVISVDALTQMIQTESAEAVARCRTEIYNDVTKDIAIQILSTCVQVLEHNGYGTKRIQRFLDEFQDINKNINSEYINQYYNKLKEKHNISLNDITIVTVNENLK